MLDTKIIIVKNDEFENIYVEVEMNVIAPLVRDIANGGTRLVLDGLGGEGIPPYGVGQYMAIALVLWRSAEISRNDYYSNKKNSHIS